MDLANIQARHDRQVHRVAAIQRIRGATLAQHRNIAFQEPQGSCVSGYSDPLFAVHHPGLTAWKAEAIQSSTFRCGTHRGFRYENSANRSTF
jgi:hypothetical protein